MVPDERIPGTLNVGHTLPTFAEAAIYITVVRVDALTLWALIAASVAGAWLGAGVISRWSRRAVQRGMAAALVLTGAIIALRQLHLFPPGGDALALHGLPLMAGILGNFAFGALMTLGVGLYAPCMGMVSLLGMNPTAAFPIMMGSCAFLMPVASLRFIRANAYDRTAALGPRRGRRAGRFDRGLPGKVSPARCRPLARGHCRAVHRCCNVAIESSRGARGAVGHAARGSAHSRSMTVVS